MKVNNFSKEGIGILSKESLEKGKDLELELSIPGDNVPVVLQGEIAWASDPMTSRSQYKSGLKFKKVANKDRGRILEYIYQKWLSSAEVDVKK